MTIVMVGQGSLPIPPLGWGAVEQIIWEYTTRLRQGGHRVFIVNKKWRSSAIQVALLVRRHRVDVVHVHQERTLRWIVPLVGRRALVVATSHAPLDQQQDRPEARQALGDLTLARHHLVLNAAMTDLVSARRPDALIRVQPNGFDSEMMSFSPGGNGRAICLGKLQSRKRQRELAFAMAGSDIPIDFVGPIGDEDLLAEHKPMWKGEWARKEVCAQLSNYSTLVLVSHSEGHALVTTEALGAGLSLVLSPGSSQNLDRAQPFIKVVEHPSEWRRAIEDSVRANQSYRSDVRRYGLENFSYDYLVATYLNTIESWRLQNEGGSVSA